MIKQITLDDRVEWSDYIRRAAQYDCYHTWHYHSLETTGHPVLLVSEVKDDFIAVPLVKRKIEGTEYFDLTSVYGFTGPISNKKVESVEDCMIRHFTEDMLNYFDDEKIVTVFSRLHPFYDQSRLISPMGGLHDNGKTIFIDLTCAIEDQIMKYQPSMRSKIKKLREVYGLTFQEERGEAAAQKFKELYLESMTRINASESYYFSDNYFKTFAATDEYDARFVMIYDKDVLVCSSIVMLTNGIMQAHLIGVKSDYVKLSPGKLMVDELCRLARENNINYYNLGGGVGFREDNVYQWKRCFSDRTHDFKTWRFIANSTIYEKLVQEKNLSAHESIDFFPLYRYNQ